MVVPFRAVHLDLLPSLLKSIAAAAAMQPNISVNVIVAPVSWKMLFPFPGLQAQVRVCVHEHVCHVRTRHPVLSPPPPACMRLL